MWVPTETIIGPVRKGGWALRAEFYGNFSLNSLGIRLDDGEVAAWSEGGGEPSLHTPRHTPYVVLRAPVGVHVEMDERDEEILREVAAGKTSRTIAADRDCTPVNVENYREKILDKFGATSMQDAVARAVVLSKLPVTPEIGHRRTTSGRVVHCLGLCSVGYTEDAVNNRLGGSGRAIAKSAMIRGRDDLATSEGPLRNRVDLTRAAFAQGIFVVGGSYNPDEATA